MIHSIGITAAEAPSTNVDEASAPLFPLPFTPFEFYYLLEDRPDFPSVFPVTLECLGTLDRAALAEAYQTAHERHPFLSAQIDSADGKWPSWNAGETTSIVWTDGAPAVPWTATATASTPGLRLRVRQRGNQYEFQFVFHHVAVDGMGAFLFIADLFLAYAHFASGETGPPDLRLLQPERLRNRDGHQLFNRKVTLTDLLRVARVFIPLYLRRPALVCNHGQSAREFLPADTVGEYLVHLLTEEETAALSRVSRVQTVMLNDLLLRDYFLTLDAWNRGTAEGRRPIRIVAPTNLRRREDYRMPAANVFSLAFLTRKAGQCVDRGVLLASIRDEMATIKRDKRGLYFEAGLRISCAWPAMMRWSLGRKWPFATAVFTNLGTGLDNVPLPVQDGRRVCGDLIFEGGAGAGPLRPDTRVSIAVHTYAGRMSVCLRCDPSLFNPEQQQALLDAYLGQLRQTIDQGT